MSSAPSISHQRSISSTMPTLYRCEKFGDKYCKKGKTLVVSKIVLTDSEFDAFIENEIADRHDADLTTAKIAMSKKLRYPPKVVTVFGTRDALAEKMKKGLEEMSYNASTGEVFGIRRVTKKTKKRRRKKKKKAVSNWIVGMPK